MKLFNKRGDEGTEMSVGLLVGLIILIVFGLVLLGWWITNQFKPETFDYTSCQTSVNLRSVESLGVHPAEALQVPLMCKTQNIVVKSADETAIQKTIADQMYYCWTMLGQGEKDFFYPTTFLGVGVDQASCVICSTITFNPNVQKKIPQVDIFPYLSTAYIPVAQDDPNSNLTYLQYFTGNTKAKLPTEVQGDQYPIDTSEELAVVIYGSKRR